MTTRIRRATVFVWFIALLVLVALGWRLSVEPGAGIRSAKVAGTTAIGGAFTLVDHNGRTVTEADFRGRFTLVYFGYTYCPDVCPTALTAISEALEILGPDGDGIVPVFVTVDPGRDTPEQLSMYVRHFHPRLVGLTGTAKQVAAAAKAYQVYYAKARGEGTDADDYLMDHTSITYLMGPDGAFRVHFANGTDAESMARRIREFL